MAWQPVWKNGAPLWIRNGSGVLMPAGTAADPCACCGGGGEPYDYCNCLCTDFTEQVTEIHLTLSGFSDCSCEGNPISCPGCITTYHWSRLNGTYVVPTSTNELLVTIPIMDGCSGLPDCAQLFDVGNVTAIQAVVACPDGDIVVFMNIVTDFLSPDTIVGEAGRLDWEENCSGTGDLTFSSEWNLGCPCPPDFITGTVTATLSGAEGFECP